jgi:hypothetical protein
MAVDANFSADLGQGAIGHKPLEARDTKKAVIRATQADMPLSTMLRGDASAETPRFSRDPIRGANIMERRVTDAFSSLLLSPRGAQSYVCFTCAP